MASDHLTFDPHIFSFLLPFPFKEVLLVKSALSTSPHLLPTDKGSERRGNMTVRGMEMPVFLPLSTWIQPSPKPVLLYARTFLTWVSVLSHAGNESSHIHLVKRK